MSENTRPTEVVDPRFLRLAVVCLLVFAVFNATMLWRFRSQISEGYADFTPFYTAGKIVASGQSARLYDPALEWQIQRQFSANVSIRRGPLPYIRPPFEALLFLPFSYFSYPIAFVVWLACKVLLLLAFCFALPRAGGALSSWKFRGLVCLAFFPVGFDLVQGQDAVLLLLIVTLSLRLMLKGAEFSSGAVLALGLFKFHLILPLFLITVVRRLGRFAFGFAGTAAILFWISLAMVHWAGIFNYPKYLLTLKPNLGTLQSQSMPNFRGIITVLMGRRSLPTAAQLLLVALAVVGIVLWALWWRSHSHATVYFFSSSIAIVLVTSYYVNSYDLTLLLLPLLLLSGPILKARVFIWPRTLFIASSALLLCTPLLWFFALKVDQLCWLAVVLLVFGISVALMGRTGAENLAETQEEG